MGWNRKDLLRQPLRQICFGDSLPNQKLVQDCSHRTDQQVCSGHQEDQRDQEPKSHLSDYPQTAGAKGEDHHGREAGVHQRRGLQTLHQLDQAPDHRRGLYAQRRSV